MTVATLLSGFLAIVPPVTHAASATSSTKEMYEFWCTAARTESILCKHHAFVGEMTSTTDAEQKKAISAKISALLKSSAPPSPAPAGSPRQPSPFSKEYQNMKMGYCATNPAGGKILCSTAASQYKTAGASSTRPLSSTSSSTLSYNEVWVWYCGRPKKDADTTKMCENYEKRSAVLTKLRVSNTPAEERTTLLKDLKTYPTVAYATTQAIYADFCKVAEHATKATCTRLKMTQASVTMRAWYCAQPDKAESSSWCKRSAVLDKLQKIPSSTASPDLLAERKTLSEQYAAFSKPPIGGGVSQSALIAKEISAAKAAFCDKEENKKISYCTIPSPGLGGSMFPTSFARPAVRSLSSSSVRQPMATPPRAN